MGVKVVLGNERFTRHCPGGIQLPGGRPLSSLMEVALRLMCVSSRQYADTGDAGGTGAGGFLLVAPCKSSRSQRCWWSDAH